MMNTLDRYSSTIALLIVVGTFAAAALVAAVGRVPEAAIQPTPALAYITVFATPQPTAPTADTQAMIATIARLERRVAELEEERSAPVYVEMAAPQAAPTVAPPTPQPAPQLQEIQAGEDMSPALLREAMDQ